MPEARFLVRLVWLGLSAVLGLSPGAWGTEAPRLEISSHEVGKYEKLEFVAHVDVPCQNPFDPDQADLAVLVTTPSGRRVSIPAFYCQGYERRRVGQGRRGEDWFYPTGEPEWKARFAPMEKGEHLAVAQWNDGSGTVRSEAVRFRSMSSNRKGFLRASRRDPRFFALADGEPFFAIGQNLAFIGGQQYVDLTKAEEVFAALADHGANFLRIWTCCQDWAMAVEARKSAWGRSWHWDPPIVPMPDPPDGEPGRQCVKLAGEDGARLAVSPSHPVALLPETGYVLRGRVRTDGHVGVGLEISGVEPQAVAPAGTSGRWADFRCPFTTGSGQRWLGRTAFRLDGSGTAWLDGLSLREAGGGPELLWEAAVNRPARGFYNPVDCFMLDQLVEAAERNGVYLQLCLITRDLYMKSLEDEASPEYDQAIRDARKLMRYAVARWGYSTHVAAWEYFNEMNPGLPTDRFYEELGEYLEEIDVYRHLRCTSTWGPSAKDCRHPKLDVAEVHFYVRPSDKERGKDEVQAVVDRAAFLREHAPSKPALVGEFGLATERWGLSGDMKADAELTHFHNSLWASGLSGLSGTVLFWWWDQLDRMDAYGHYRPLADFLADVPFPSAGLNATSAAVSPPGVRVIGLDGDGCSYLWLFNTDAAWATRGVRGVKPAEIRDATLQLPDAAPGTYRVEWWDTYRGKIVRQEDVSASDSSLRLPVPAFDRDLACKIRRARDPQGERE